MGWFLQLMDELGIACRVGHPAAIRQAETRRQKHDRRDATLLLQLLVEHRFPATWMPTTELRDLRALLLHRHQWVRMRTRVQHALQAIALNHGLRRGPALWTRDGQAAIAALPLPRYATRSTQRVARVVSPLDGTARAAGRPGGTGSPGPAPRHVAHDASGRGPRHGSGDGGVPRRPQTIQGCQGTGELRRDDSQ